MTAQESLDTGMPYSDDSESKDNLVTGKKGATSAPTIRSGTARHVGEDRLEHTAKTNAFELLVVRLATYGSSLLPRN